MDTSLLCSRTFGNLKHRCGPVRVGAPYIRRVKSTDALIPACGETPGPFSSSYSLSIIRSTLPFPGCNATSFPCLAPFVRIPSPALPPARPPHPPPHPSERSSEKVLCKDWPTLEDHTSSAFPEQWLLGILFGYLPVPSGFL